MSNKASCFNCIHWKDEENRCTLNDDSVIERECYFKTRHRKKDSKDKIIERQSQQIHDLQEQLKNAIVPKFKVGQECWGIVPKTFWNKESYTIHFKVKAYIPDNNGIVLMLEDGITNLHYSYEWQVFATKAEAEKRLAELKGEHQ